MLQICILRVSAFLLSLVGRPSASPITWFRPLPLHLSPSYHYPLTGILQQSVKLVSLPLLRHLQSSLNTVANDTF